MGGCCCCASKGTELNSSPTFFRYPASEEREPLSAHQAAISPQPAGLLVDTNLDTTVPDTYHPPPAPIPYELYSVRSPTPTRNRDSTPKKTDTVLPASNTESVGDVNTGSNMEAKVKDIDCDKKGSANVELGSLEDEISDDLKKSIDPLVPPRQDEEDVCPTCLEEYDEENPRMITKCEHHFHLACILEWMERSDTCPVCDQSGCRRINYWTVVVSHLAFVFECLLISSAWYRLQSPSRSWFLFDDVRL